MSAVLPGFTGFRCVREGGGFGWYEAAHSAGGVFTVWVAPARLGGWVAADGAEFLPDARAAMALRHPNLAAVLHFTRTAEHFVVVTEKVEGRTLGELLRGGQIDARGGLEVILQASEAVGHAHGAGVLHRALNPECLIVDANGRAKVMGFGFANLYFPYWNAGLAGGRMLDYVAVELHLPGMAAATPRSDIFSLGVILYRLFTGSLPKGSFFDLPSQRAGVETYLDDAVLRAMHSNAESRPESVEELIEELTGRRRRAWDGGVRAKKEDGFRGGDHAEHSADGALGWFRLWMAWVPLAVLLAAGGIGAYLYFQKDKAVEVSGEGAVLRYLQRIGEAGRMLASGGRLQGLAAMTDVAGEMPVNLRTLGSLLDVLIANGEYDAALELGAGVLDRMEAGTAGSEGVRDRFESARRGIGEFLEMRRLAEAARTRAWVRAEHEALTRARAIMPQDRQVMEALRASPVTVQNALLAVLADLREKNPAQETWRYHARIRRGYVELDLAGNALLADVSALSAAPIQALELGGTAVRNLEALKDLPLRRLGLDGTLVEDLEPLSGMPLRTLSFEGARVAKVPEGEWFEAIPAVRGSAGGAKLRRSGMLELGEPWENALGMRFRPVTGDRILLAERETSVAEFRAYVSERGTGSGESLRGFEDGGWRPIEGNWEAPGFPSGEEYPVVGVSALEAEGFCDWLTERDRKAGAIAEHQRYRLPLDLEWSAAAGIAEHPMLGALSRPLGRKSAEAVRIGSPWELEIAEGLPREDDVLAELADGGEWIRPIAGALPTGGGFHDLGGNAREWCADAMDRQRRRVVVRGGGRENRRGGGEMRSVLSRVARLNDVGFRVALELAPPADAHVLSDHLVKGDWGAARMVALRLAVQSENPFMRDAGWSFLELAPLLESGDRKDRLRAIDGARAFGGNHYAPVRVPMPWKAAERFAASLGGKLASVATAEEAAFIDRHFLRPEDAMGYWSAAVRRDDHDPWEWSTGGDAELLVARMEGTQTGEIDSPETWLGVLLAAAPSKVPGEPRAAGRWLSERHSERHGFLVEWEGTDAGGRSSGLAARPSAGVDPTDERGE